MHTLHVRKKEFIREINDPIEGHEDFSHRIFRYFIRLGIITKFTNFDIYFHFLEGLSIIFSKKNRSMIIKNKFYFKYFRLLKLKQFRLALDQKLTWARFILANEDETTDSVSLARAYLDLVETKKSMTTISEPVFVKHSEATNLYYIYGPNASDLPKLYFPHATYVFTKFPSFDILNYSKRFLFLNNFTIANMNRKTIEDRSTEYDSVFIPANISPFVENMIQMPNILGGNIASPMGLGRIIETLISVDKNAIFYFHGFDLGLSEVGYSGNILTGFDLNNKVNFERQYCKSLAVHDFFYNFLYVKSKLDSNNCVGSNDFINIMNMTLDEYVEKLVFVRDFSVL